MEHQVSSASNRPAMATDRQPAVELALLAILFCIIAGVTVGVTWRLRSIRASQPAAVAQLRPPTIGDMPAFVPDFSLVDQDGKAVSLADLKGSIWVVNFFFTSCPVQCPAMNMKMSAIRRALPEGANARLVSITVDPEHDSPEVLAEYAAAFRAKDERWMFLTGDKESIVRLAREGFKLPAGENPSEHSLRLALVDRDGRIRGYFNSTEDDSIASLQSEMRKLLAETAP